VRNRPREVSVAADEPQTLEGDRALLDAFRRGERDAFTRVFHMYVDQVAGMLRAGIVVDVDGRRTRIAVARSESDLENLVQETFAKVFAPAARDGFDGIRPFGAYITTIARNIAIDRARRQQRDAKHVTVVEHIDRLAAPTGTLSNPEIRLEEGQILAIVVRFRDALADADREVFRARYEAGLPLRQAAKSTGLGIFEMRRRDTRIRLALLEKLREAGFLNTARVRIGKSVLGARDDGSADGGVS
jgi:RNA polymerase sigma factor (sigma-70 family)